MKFSHSRQKIKFYINLMNISSVTLILLTCISISEYVHASDSGESFNLSEVAPGVFLHKGKHVEIDHTHHDDIANIGFIIGNKCVAVIDSGGSINIGNKLL
ncbi:MAG: hypothetical protein GTO02_08865, partial [Candidatus Dadabacteria bacterium]|nr:hypothetical protein [Candidatus Dadabacteria bacterium]